MQRLKGLGVSPGVAAGRALILRRSAQEVRFRIAATEIERELARLEGARARGRQQLTQIKEKVQRAAGRDHAYLFEAQLLMLDDPMLIGRATDLIAEEHLNAEWALQRASEDLSAFFDLAEDTYLRERKGDLVDVIGRLRQNLRPTDSGLAELVADLTVPHLLIADDLAPSIAAQIDWTRILGFATDAGSWTYHTAILARSLHVPAIVALRDASSQIAPGVTVLIDGTTGEVAIDPPADELARLSRAHLRRRAIVNAHEAGPATTVDGVRIRLEANIEFPTDVAAARESGAEGIGLYRSEYLRADGALDALGEQTQYEIYRRIVESMAPAPVTIRTFDVGEEQLGGSPVGAGGARRRLGLQAIRLSLARQELFRTQLKALIRASAHGRLRIMFPFVSGVEELREARAILTQVSAELQGGRASAADVPVGIMIEIPSAVLTADLLAREVDFFSIGTNDLIQYCLAVDRTDNRLSHLYEPLHPAVLRAIRLVRRTARRRGVPVSLCGEMAAAPRLLALLVGLGITEFSMTPESIPRARRVIRHIRVDRMRRIAACATRGMPVAEIEREIDRYLETADEPL